MENTITPREKSKKAYSIVRKKQSWKRFGFKAGIFLILLACVSLFFVRFTIAFDSQEDRSLPDHIVFLIDKQNKTLERGNIYAFSTEALEGVFNNEKNVVKVLEGLPGDTVQIDSKSQVVINGNVVAKGLPLAEALNKKETDFHGKGQLPANNYWFMGKSERSFDSRYWGTINNEQVIGRAYPVF